MQTTQTERVSKRFAALVFEPKALFGSLSFIVNKLSDLIFL